MPKLGDEAVLAQLARESLRTSFRALGLVAKPVPQSRRLALAAAGNPSERFDFALDVRFPDGKRCLLIEVKRTIASLDLAEVRQGFQRLARTNPRLMPLLFIPRVNERDRDRLSRLGISHADLAGTLSVRHGDVFIEVQGSQTPVDWRAKSHGVNLFSDRASLVLRVLLRAPERPLGVTAIAAESGVTKGWASIVTRALVDAGYADRADAGFRIVEPLRVLQDWTAAYSWRKNPVRSYHSPLEYHKRLAVLEHLTRHPGQKYALTLLAGSSMRAPHVEHDQLHLYVAPDSLEQFQRRAREMLYLEPVASGGNLQIMEPYYKKSAFFGVEMIEGLPVVSALQLYLDLYHYPARGREAAKVLLRSRLARELGVSPRDAASVS